MYLFELRCILYLSMHGAESMLPIDYNYTYMINYIINLLLSLSGGSVFSKEPISCGVTKPGIIIRASDTSV